MTVTEPDRPPGTEAEVLKALREAVAEVTSGADHLTVLFSGGLDSAILTWLLPAEAVVQLVTVGLEGAADLEAARDAADRLGRPVDLHILSSAAVLDAWSRWHSELGALREPTRSVALAFTLATEAAPAGRVICGQGADELFYGYAHFRGLSEVAARRRGREDLDLLERSDWPRAVRVGRAIGRDLRAPFLDPRVQWAGGGLPPPRLDEPPKIALRRAASLAGLPSALVQRPKRAFQYGSGIAKALARAVPAGSPPSG